MGSIECDINNILLIHRKNISLEKTKKKVLKMIYALIHHDFNVIYVCFSP